MRNPCGYPSLDQRTRADISTASRNMADDARRGTSIHGQEAQLHLSRMYTFRQVMSLETLCTSLLHIQERKGISCPSLFTASFGTQQLECWNLGCYYQNHSYFLVQMHLISQLPDMSRRRFLTMYFLSQLACRPKKLSGTIATKHSMSKSRSWRISTIDQLEPLIDDLLLLSDYPTQEGRDLPAKRAWI